ncbi:MAG TPA: tetratricopeptide repeat protein, partial [Candidatus Xenobia bacterium]
DLHQQAQAALQGGHPEVATHLFATLVDHARSAHDRGTEAQAQAGWGQAELALGHSTLALKHWELSADMYHALSAGAAEAGILDRMAQAEETDGHLKAALSLYGRALQRAPADLAPDLHRHRGELEADMGESEASLHDLQAAAAAYRRAGDTTALTDLLTSMGRLYRDQGDTDAALKAFEEAARIQPDAPHQALLQLESAQALMAEHQYALAATQLNRARTVLANTDDRAPLDMAQGNLDAALGNEEAARTDYQEAASLWHGRDADSEASAWYRLGLLRERTHPREALSHFQNAVELLSRHRSAQLIHALLPYSWLQAQQGELAEGVHSATTAQAMAAQLDMPVLEERATGALAMLQEAQGFRTEALVSYETAAGLADQYSDLGALWRWQWGIGRLAEAGEHSDEALRFYRMAMKTEERVPLRCPDVAGSYLEEPSGPYRSAIRLMLRQGGPADAALALAERSRRVEWRQSLVGVPFADAWHEQGQTAQLEQQLLTRLQALQERLVSAPGGSARRRAAALAQAVESEVHNRAALRSASPRLAALLETEPAAPVVPPDTVLVEFCELSNGLAVFTVDRQGVHVNVPLMPRRELADRVRQVSQSLAGTTPDWAAAGALYARLFGDAALPRHVVIVPSEGLCRVPFAALPADPTQVPQSCLGLTHEVTVAPVAPTRALTPVQPRPRLVDPSTWSALSRAGAVGVLQLSHPLALAWDAPWSSTISLTDGSRTALELMGLSSQPSLWVLSGQNFQHDGSAPAWMTLSRGFLDQDQSRLMWSLWPGDPALLGQFYQRLEAGAPLGEALMEARKALAAEDPAPRRWAWLEAF